MGNSMKWAIQIYLVLIHWLIAGSAIAQNFINPDLEGPVTGPSCLPPNWESVPYGDVNCEASGSMQATPDLTDANGNAAGILGNPFTGTTFISCLYGGVGSVYHEGIQQSVSGFSLGNVYIISFYQTVIKQINGIDASGSWAVYVNGLLAAITPPSRSPEPHSSTTHVWDQVNVTFTATANSHLIQFLPADDDNNRAFSVSDTAGALRMGIDNIRIRDIVTGLEEKKDAPEVTGVYPNPFSQYTTVTFKYWGTESYNFDLYNYKGENVRTISNINTGNVIVEKKELSPGFYFFVLKSSGGPLTTGRLTVD